MLRKSLALVVIAAAIPSLSAAASSARATAAAVPEASALKLDGEFDETVWEHAPAINDFRQRDPKDDAAPSFPTVVKIAYDAANMYIAVAAHDPDPDKLVALRTRRDAQSPSDWISVLIDSFHDRRTAFEFAVNPAGVKRDAYWFNDNNRDEGWDAVWDAAVSRDGSGWRAEFRIPFSQLRFHRADDATFGFAVVREIGRLNETDTWPLISKSANGYVSSFGELTGLQLSGGQKRLELVPYVVGQVKTQPEEPGNPFVSPRDPDASIGLDLKYAVRPGMTLTATVNPDFGQVEADPAVVNLSGFETFFSERRPFFVEGSGMFQFDMDCNDGSCSGLFYPRRIGRSPRGAPEVPDDGYSTVPQQTTILGAAKLTGKVGPFSIGAMNAVTSEEHARIAVGDLRSSQSVEPLTNYSVVRGRREFANQSTVGFIVANTARSLNDETSFLPGSAVAGGIDWDWRLKKRYALQGYWTGSTIHGSAQSIDELAQTTVHSFQRPDADHLDYDPAATSMNGYGAAIGLAKIGGSKVRFNSNVAVKSPGLDLNDLGFMQRADVRSQSNWIQFRRDTPTKRLRNFRWNLNQWGSWNYGGDRLDLGGNVNAHWTFTNNWRTGTGVTALARPFDDRATRGGPGAYGNGRVVWWQYVEGDDRKAVSAGYFFNVGGNREGSHFIAAGPFVNYRPASFVSVNGGVRVFRNVDDAQWIENTASGHYVFGHLDQTTIALTLRANYTITPQLTIQIYGEPFVSAGDYSGFKELVNGRAPRYADRYAPFDYTLNPDFNFRSFRTTNVLRWEYRPGSTLFVVWQQGREDVLESGRFRFARDFGGIFGAPSRNVFLVKVSRWLNW